jgi:hypothetical protein
MDTKKIPPVATPHEPPLPHAPQEEQQEESGKSVLFKALLWFLLLPLLSMFLLKWLLQI